MPLLAAIFSAMGVFGGYLIGVVIIGVDSGAFWSQMQASVDLREDILNGVIKSVVFGVAVTLIALFEGYDAPPDRRGRFLRGDTHGGHFRARGAGTGLRAHLVHVYRSLIMKRTTVDLWVGVFVTAGVIALFVLALKVGNATTVSASNGYTVFAEFDNIGGLKVRAPVKSAGVVVGRVERIVLDQQKYMANVYHSNRQPLQVPEGQHRLRFSPPGCSASNTSGWRPAAIPQI